MNNIHVTLLMYFAELWLDVRERSKMSFIESHKLKVHILHDTHART